MKTGSSRKENPKSVSPLNSTASGEGRISDYITQSDNQTNDSVGKCHHKMLNTQGINVKVEIEKHIEFEVITPIMESSRK